MLCLKLQKTGTGANRSLRASSQEGNIVKERAGEGCELARNPLHMRLLVAVRQVVDNFVSRAVHGFVESSTFQNLACYIKQ